MEPPELWWSPSLGEVLFPGLPGDPHGCSVYRHGWELVDRPADAVRFVLDPGTGDTDRDRAARWAHELAEVDRVLAQRCGDRVDQAVGEPLAENVAGALDRMYWAGRDDERHHLEVQFGIPLDGPESVLAQDSDPPMHPDPPAEVARRVRAALDRPPFAPELANAPLPTGMSGTPMPMVVDHPVHDSTLPDEIEGRRS